MEWFDYLKNTWNLDVIIIVLVFLSGFFQEKYLCEFVWAKRDARIDASLKTLAVSFVVSSIYIYLMYKESKTADAATAMIPWAKYFISYFTATSLYDLGIRPLRKWIQRKLGDSDSNKTDNN